MIRSLDSTRHRVYLTALGLLVAGLAMAALAWACSPQAELKPVAPDSGPAGTPLEVSGKLFLAEQPVEIRWDSVNGPLLATTTGPAFENVKITIPAGADEETHAILGVAYETGADRRLAGVARTPFTVTADRPASSGTRSRGADGREPATGPSKRSLGASGGALTTGPVRNHRATSGETAEPPNAAPALSRSPGVNGGSAPQTAATPGAAAPGSEPSSAASPAATARDESPGSNAVPGPVAGEGRPLADRGQPPIPPAVSEKSASGDLWSGLHAGGSSSPPTLASPTPPAEGSGLALTAGATLLGLGLMLLFAGFAFAEVRRRRRATDSHDSPD